MTGFQVLGWTIAIVVLASFWPLAQAFRHRKLKPLAAYLLFTASFALVAGAVFMALIWAGAAFLPADAMAGPIAATVILLLALLPGFAAAVWTVRRPQNRRMPR